MQLKKTIAVAVLAMIAAAGANAESFPPAPPPGGTHLGGVIVNPYGHTPLVAIINRDGKSAENIHVTVHGRGVTDAVRTAWISPIMLEKLHF